MPSNGSIDASSTALTLTGSTLLPATHIRHHLQAVQATSARYRFQVACSALTANLLSGLHPENRQLAHQEIFHLLPLCRPYFAKTFAQGAHRSIWRRITWGYRERLVSKPSVVGLDSGLLVPPLCLLVDHPCMVWR
jgi:hypothetical protein